MSVAAMASAIVSRQLPRPLPPRPAQPHSIPAPPFPVATFTWVEEQHWQLVHNWMWAHDEGVHVAHTVKGRIDLLWRGSQPGKVTVRLRHLESLAEK